MLDPFTGSGVTPLEAVIAGRKGIAFDLNPLSALLVRVTATAIPVRELEKAFDTIKAKCEMPVRALYRGKCGKCKRTDIELTGLASSYVVKCPNCSRRIVMNDAKRPKTKRQNIYLCPHCRKEFSYGNQPIVDEVGILARYQCARCGPINFMGKRSTGVLAAPKIKLDFWYPKASLSYPDGNAFATVRRVKSIEDLITGRNLKALSLILDAIRTLPEPEIRDAFLVAFSSAVPQATRMMIWTAGSGPSWKVPEYLVYPVHWELNVWERFENRVDSLLRARADANSVLPPVQFAETCDDLRAGANLLIKTGSAIDMKFLPDNSIDYVFTDPPYNVRAEMHAN